MCVQPQKIARKVEVTFLPSLAGSRQSRLVNSTAELLASNRGFHGLAYLFY